MHAEQLLQTHTEKVCLRSLQPYMPEFERGRLNSGVYATQLYVVQLFGATA